MSLTLPTPQGVAELVSGLLGKPATPKKTTIDWDKSPAHSIAEFVAADGTLEVLFLADIAFAAFSGAALVLVPVAVAQDSIRKQRMDPGLFENYREVVNVLTAVFRQFEQRVILGTIHEGPRALPEPAQRLLATPGARLDLELNLPGYGVGRCSLLLRA